MDFYKCKYLDRNYKIIEEAMFASSEAELISQLSKDFKTVINIKKQKIKLKNFSLFFFKLLYQLTSNGYDIIESLDIVMNFFNDHRQLIIKNILDYIKLGHNISSSLERFPELFKPIAIETIRAAEETGKLSQALGDIIQFLETQERMKKKILKVSSYPLITLGLVIIILLIWIIFLVPHFSLIFKDLGIQTPLITKILLKINKLLYLILPILAGLIIFIKLKRNIILNKIPAINKIRKEIIKFRFCESLSLMLKEQVNFIFALECILKRPEYNEYKKIIPLIKSGKTVKFAMSDLFNNYELIIIEAGSKSGKLHTAFKSISDLINLNLTEKFNKLTSLLPSILIIFTGLILLILAYSTFFPLYNSAPGL